MASVADLQKKQRERLEREHDGNGKGAGKRTREGVTQRTHDDMTDAEQKIALEAEAKEAEERAAAEKEAIATLKKGPGGTPSSAFALQITGPEIELPAKYYPTFEKDREVVVNVAGVEIRAWVKAHKDVTVKKGGHAQKTVVVVLEESTDQAQMRLGEDDVDDVAAG